MLETKTLELKVRSTKVNIHDHRNSGVVVKNSKCDAQNLRCKVNHRWAGVTKGTFRRDIH